MTRIAINGFGRIGRLFFRQAFGHKDIEIVAVNDLGNAGNLAYLLQYDTVYGEWDKRVTASDNSLSVEGTSVAFVQEKDPTRLPWKELKVDIVIEATGVFDEYGKAQAHLDAGAQRVIITAPAKDADGPEGKTVLVGINEGDLKKVVLSSNGSCTTNAASPIMQVLSETVGIEKALLTTVHGYTASQNLVDGTTHSSDLRRGRAAAQNIVPSSTGAAKTVGKAIPEFADTFDGIAMRVPVVSGSIADITLVAKQDTTVDEINDLFKRAADDPRWKDILAVTEEPIVSSDIIGKPYGAIVDLSFTRVVGGNLVKVLSWYDNEWGYVTTLFQHAMRVGELV